jgi:hypothetical protein
MAGCLVLQNNFLNKLLSRLRKAPDGDIDVDRLQCHAKACVDKGHDTNPRQVFAQVGLYVIWRYFLMPTACHVCVEKFLGIYLALVPQANYPLIVFSK